MTPRDLRTQFRDFTGDERYSKFIRAVNDVCRSKGRLLYWQERLWDTFVSRVPEAAIGIEELFEAFAFCDVHDSPLRSSAPAEHDREIRDTPEYGGACLTLFPFARNDDRSCADCIRERERWIAENQELCRVLRCRTTYEEHCRRRLEGLADQPDIAAKIKKRAREIEAEMQPGDELWEWDAGGWHNLSGTFGVAIVRDGEVVKRWCEGRS